MASYTCNRHGKLMMAHVCPDCVKALVEAAQAARNLLRSDYEQSAGDRCVDETGDTILWRAFMPVEWHNLAAALARFQEAPDA